jgi:hypothetical protein
MAASDISLCMVLGVVIETTCTAGSAISFFQSPVDFSKPYW